MTQTKLVTLLRLHCKTLEVRVQILYGPSKVKDSERSDRDPGRRSPKSVARYSTGSVHFSRPQPYRVLGVNLRSTVDSRIRPYSHSVDFWVGSVWKSLKSRSRSIDFGSSIIYFW